MLHEPEEGIDNHFTVTVPGRENQYLILPFGFHWSEARASDMIVFEESGKTLEGEGVVELSKRLADSNNVRTCLTAQWFRYALGRTEDAGDAASIVGAVAAFAPPDSLLGPELSQPSARLVDSRARLGHQAPERGADARLIQAGVPARLGQ